MNALEVHFTYIVQCTVGLGDSDFFFLTHDISPNIYRDFRKVSWLFVFHSRMIALQPITTGMYPSTSVTINRKFICIVCTYFWSCLLLFLTSKSWKDCPHLISMECLTWLTTWHFFFQSWYVFFYPFASEAVYTRNLFFDRMSDSV